MKGIELKSSEAAECSECQRKATGITNLAKALHLAQADMGGAVKDAKNPFFKSNYADLTSVIKALKEPFAKHGLSYTQFPCNSDVGAGVGVITRLMHTSGEWLEMAYVLPLVKKDPQAAGSAITYARRYALMSVAGIPTADDDAESASLRESDRPTLSPQPTGEKVVQTVKVKLVTESQTLMLEEMISKTKIGTAKFCKAYECTSVAGLPANRFNAALRALKAKAKEME